MTTSESMETTFTGERGIALFARAWRPEGTPRGVIVIVHGFLAHSGQYEWAAQQFVEQGFAVHAYDQRGHGRSDGERYWVEFFSDYVRDLERFIGSVRVQEPRLPIFLLGHSAGGVVSTVFAQEHANLISGLICESFAFEVPPPEFVLQALKGVAVVFPHAPILSLKPTDFSRDPAVVDAITNDPLVIHEPGPAHTLAELVRAHDRLGQSFNTVTVPVLIIHGTADKATRPHGSQRFYDETGSADKTLKMYEGHFHDLLADVGKEEVLSDIVAWVNARL